MKCAECFQAMKPLFSSWYCPNECDIPEVLAKRKAAAKAEARTTINSAQKIINEVCNKLYPKAPTLNCCISPSAALAYTLWHSGQPIKAAWRCACGELTSFDLPKINYANIKKTRTAPGDYFIYDLPTRTDELTWRAFFSPASR